MSAHYYVNILVQTDKISFIHIYLYCISDRDLAGYAYFFQHRSITADSLFL